MQLSVVKGRVDFLPIIEREFHRAYSIYASSLSARARSHLERIPAPWLTIHVEEKPQAKNYPEDNECQATIMDDPFLVLFLRFDFGGHRWFKGNGIAHIFTALVAVVVALRHL
jgi:hypothetical protein